MRGNKHFGRTLLLFSLLILCLGTAVRANNEKKQFITAKRITQQTLDKLDLADVDKVMVVAHPDDETLWGGGHLLQDNYLVVCLTNANTAKYGKRRQKELKKVIEQSGSRCIMLNYPDYTGSTHHVDHWTSCRSKIKKDLAVLLQYKNWTEVATHNAKGEYGHRHHKMTSQLVTKCFKKYAPAGCTLKYFGKYYGAKKIRKINQSGRLSASILKQKKALLKYYTSQRNARFNHMVPYENWKTAAKIPVDEAPASTEEGSPSTDTNQVSPEEETTGADTNSDFSSEGTADTGTNSDSSSEGTTDAGTNSDSSSEGTADTGTNSNSSDGGAESPDTNSSSSTDQASG